ncbi:hypothetical protein GGS23DRAFT_471778 [Durotheca rogersii]|uniref:uncharacterized protein n=1 Tax=Durotheca rogersii TaxID=419775 RepID=UPI00221EA18C|nr:uncharacterized protein GGS23DRAFT_471778 [Durotheca rogersii]KAI5855010.1 hypothetical protein GGS23DRAFT_471778 [Durotheca rogersii]
MAVTRFGISRLSTSLGGRGGGERRGERRRSDFAWSGSGCVVLGDGLAPHFSVPFFFNGNILSWYSFSFFLLLSLSFFFFFFFLACPLYSLAHSERSEPHVYHVVHISDLPGLTSGIYGIYVWMYVRLMCDMLPIHLCMYDVCKEGPLYLYLSLSSGATLPTTYYVGR